MSLPTKGWMCGECLEIKPSFASAERCCRARLLGHSVLDLSNPEDRESALDYVTIDGSSIEADPMNAQRRGL